MIDHATNLFESTKRRLHLLALLSAGLSSGCISTEKDKPIEDILAHHHFLDLQERALKASNYVIDYPFSYNDEVSTYGQLLDRNFVGKGKAFIIIEEIRVAGADKDFPILITRGSGPENANLLSEGINVSIVKNEYLWDQIKKRTRSLLIDEVLTFISRASPQPPVYCVTFYDGKEVFRGIFQSPWSIYGKEKWGDRNVSNPNQVDFGESLFSDLKSHEYFPIYNKAQEYNEWILFLGDSLEPNRFKLYDKVVHSLLK